MMLADKAMVGDSIPLLQSTCKSYMRLSINDVQEPNAGVSNQAPVAGRLHQRYPSKSSAVPAPRDRFIWVIEEDKLGD